MLPTRKRRFNGLIGWLVLSYIAAGLGAAASVDAREFYAGLTLPPWAPPGYLFGPVWALLYTLLGIAAWLVWRIDGFPPARRALSVFIVQLAVNAAWSWIFFKWHRGALAFGEILVLWLLIAWTTLEFFRRSRPAGALLLPYLAWVTFAGFLCCATWRLNPAQL